MVLSGSPPEPLVGRDEVVAELTGLFDAVEAGQRRLLIVEGEAGIGKTTVVRHVLSGRRTPTVWVAADEAEADLDHAVIDQLVRAAPLDAALRAELQGAIGGDPLDVGAALVRLVDRLALAPERPLVVVIDDAQWADVASLRALAFAARRLRRDPVLLCLVLRADAVTRLPSGLVRLVDDEGRRMVIEPFDRAAVRELAERAIGADVSTAAAQRLLDHTRGNPLHLETLLAELPPGAVTAPGDLPSPRSYSTLVLARLAGAGHEAGSLVIAAAVLGDPVPVATAAALAGLADPGPALDAAVVHGLAEVARAVDTAAPTITLAHPLVRAAVLDDLPPGRRAELHQRAGQLVLGAAGLRHRLLGALGPDATLWAEAVASAAAETDRGSHGTAAAILRAALVVAPDEPARARTLHEAVDQLLLAGRLDEARDLRPAVGATEPSPLREYVEGRLAYVVGPRRSARDHLMAAWHALGDLGPDDAARRPSEVGDRTLAGRVAAMLATNAVDRADGAAALPWCRAALALDPQQAAHASTAHMLAGAWALEGRYEEGLADVEALCAAIEGRAAPSPIVADLRSARGLLRLWTHDLEAAASDLETSLDASSSFVGRETARAYLAEVRYRQGRWDESILLAGRSSSIVDDTDQVWMAALPHATAARPCAARGDSDTEHLDRAAAAAAATGGGVAAGMVLVATVEVAACLRDPVRLLAAGDALRAARRPVAERIAPWRATYVEALVAVGRHAEASAVLAELEADPGTALTRTNTARAGVVLRAASGDHDVVDAVGTAALEEDPERVGPYPRARLELVLGRALRHRGERRRAVDLLETALERFRELGAQPWMERVEPELRSSGLRPSRRTMRERTELTPQEHAVAHLVAKGLTNREVGVELVVSAKTVEHHLSRIYAKLGLRSRTELARRLAPDP